MKKYLLPLIFILLLIFTLIGNCAWLSGYDQRIKLTIDNTKIDGALSDFPVTVFFTPTQGEEIFTEFDANSDYMKCAFTTSDGTTQLYAEKEVAFFISQYPPAQSDTYVKSTTKADTNHWAYYATDPAKSLTGTSGSNSWSSAYGSVTNQRFHIDLGNAKIVKRIYYENFHHSGTITNRGVQNFTFWGSNTGAGTFDDLVYANDEGWTQLTISQSTFDEHTGSDVADPKYITVTGTITYRYYAFKFADNYGNADYMGVRRIELQAEEAIYHVKVPSVASGADTDIYYYYDNDHADNTTYIGAINTTAGRTVWNSNFVAVYHMVDSTTSGTYDSTSNINHGTKIAANEPIEIVGKIHKAQDFDGSSDKITITQSAELNALDPYDNSYTIEFVVNAPQQASHFRITEKWIAGVTGYPFSIQGLASATTFKFYVWDGTYIPVIESPTAFDSVYHHFACVLDHTADQLKISKDGGAFTTETNTITSSITNAANVYIGENAAGDRPFDGILDEIRISNVARSIAWIKATYNTLWDTLLTYGSEETSAEDNAIFFGTNF